MADGEVPAGEFAFGVAVASVKDLSPFGFLFHDLAIAILLPGIGRRWVWRWPLRSSDWVCLHSGITGAGNESRHSRPAFDHHGFAALDRTPCRWPRSARAPPGRSPPFRPAHNRWNRCTRDIQLQARKWPFLPILMRRGFCLQSGAGQFRGHADALDAEHVFTGIGQFFAEGAVKGG